MTAEHSLGVLYERDCFPRLKKESLCQTRTLLSSQVSLNKEAFCVWSLKWLYRPECANDTCMLINCDCKSFKKAMAGTYC